MKCYIIAGEASGDLHGSHLVRALDKRVPGTQIRAWGGDLMAGAGAEVVKHYRDLAFMGFVEVVANLRTILGNMRFCKTDIEQFQPDVVVLIDYPGFNLRIAKWLRQQVVQGRLRCKIIYYIAPQVWAWHTSRVHAIRRDVDQVLVILPFEAAFYQKYGVKAVFVGHPLLDVIPVSDQRGTPSRTIALLPGSRMQEVGKILPIMLSAVEHFPDYEFVVAASTALPVSVYEQVVGNRERVKVVQGETYGVVRHAAAALVKSGTSTLETALLGTPQVVCYTGNPLSYRIAKRLIKIKYISLVNLIADAPVVTELIQHDFNPESVVQSLNDILAPEKAAALRAAYIDLRNLLGNSGAAEKAADLIADATLGAKP